ncbi:hypothetical protein Tco_0100038, partial [Tanacetum coccineum]
EVDKARGTRDTLVVLPAEEQPLPAAISPTAARLTEGLRAYYGFVATLNREIRLDPERDVGYGITNTWDEMLEGMQRAPTTDET